MDTSLNYILKQILASLSTSPDVRGVFAGIRKIHHGSIGKRTHFFYSFKSGGLIQLESYLELYHALLLEADPNVIEFRTQALKISMSNDQHAFPDFLVRLNNGQYEVHSIKPYSYDARSDTLHEFVELREIFARLDIKYKHICAKDLPTRQQFARLLQLYQRGHSKHWTPWEIGLAINTLEIHPKISMSNAYTIIQSVDLRPEILDYLLFHQHIRLSV